MDKIFLAGASGVIGIRVSKLLIEQGYEVYGTTRSQQKAEKLEQLGVKPIVIDVFDREALIKQMQHISPTIVMHQLTDLPTGLPENEMPEALKRNAILREVGTKNLVDAALLSGAKKLIAQSIGFIYEPGQTPYTEQSPLLNFNDPIYGETAKAVSSLETQVLNAPLIGIILRNGLLYGQDTGFDKPIEGVSSVHVDAAAYAVILALNIDHNAIFNIANSDQIIDCSKAIEQLKWNENFRINNLD